MTAGWLIMNKSYHRREQQLRSMLGMEQKPKTGEKDAEEIVDEAKVMPQE